MEQTMEQLYSEAAGKFLADRFVAGTCPKCRYEDARGDQCDACGALLNPTELLAPRCKLTGTVPVVRETRHVFLDLPSLAPRLQAYIDAASAQGGWSSNCVQVCMCGVGGGAVQGGVGWGWGWLQRAPEERTLPFLAACPTSRPPCLVWPPPPPPLPLPPHPYSSPPPPPPDIR